MTTICRLCVQYDNLIFDVFTDTLREGNVHGKILKYLNIDIKEDDNLSKFVCVNCVRKIEEFHIFRQQVEQNQQRIYPFFEENFLNENNVDIINKTSSDIGSISRNERTENSIVIQVRYDGVEKEIVLNDDIGKSTGLPASKIENPKDFSDNSSNESDNESNCSIVIESSEAEFDNELFKTAAHEGFSEFPKTLIKDGKLIVRGKPLINLLSRFYKLKCDLCSKYPNEKVYSRISTLFSHYTNVHSISGYVVCCGIKIGKPRPMSLHMARHIQPDAFKCPECGKMMSCPRILRYHIQNHLPEEQRPFACTKCPRRFSYTSALATHQISHLPVEERNTHVCDECGKTFSSLGSISKHINTAHKTNRYQQFVCHECGKQFNCKGNLSYHLTTHEQIHQAQCELCGKWLKNKLCLRKHMTQHSAIRHSCTKCSYSAVNRQCLRNHIKVHHSNDKPFSCEHCGRNFKLKNTLINHMVQHTGERRYSCEFCTKQFASSGNYYSHRKRMHPTELAESNRQKEEEQRLIRELALENRKTTNL